MEDRLLYEAIVDMLVGMGYFVRRKPKNEAFLSSRRENAREIRSVSVSMRHTKSRTEDFRGVFFFLGNE